MQHRTSAFRFCHVSLLTLGALGCSAVGAISDQAAPDTSAAALERDSEPSATGESSARKVILFVWDGLRPDSVNADDTPNLARLRDETGVNFTDNHAVFPTFTMMNGSAFATGAYPGTHGFYGNTEYQPGPTGKNASGADVDFAQPIFTEDYGILQALDRFYGDLDGSGLFLVDTLFERAHAAGLSTAAVGKSGPAFLQDAREDGSQGVILDENIAFPLDFAHALQDHGFALPANAVHYPFAEGTLELASDNGTPTATTSSALVLLGDGATSDPRADKGSPHNAKNAYLMDTYLRYILPTVDPDLSLLWFRNPDSTEHTFGPGSKNYLDALHNQDKLLGDLLGALQALGRTKHTDVIVVSDHGHSTVAGDPTLFPLRALTGAPDGTGAVGDVSDEGDSVSGDVRTADLLTRAGFAHVYDGIGCTLDPVLSGLLPDGSALYPTQTDADGSVCGKAGAKYNTASFVAPAQLPNDAIVIAANGGSDYLYVPSHDADTVAQLVIALQQRQAYGAVFVRSEYGAIDGTLPLTAIRVEGEGRASPPTPDIVVSFDWNDEAVTHTSGAVPGTEYESAQNNRGMHGSFSPRDVHNTLIAAGPDFKRGFSDEYPTGNVDVAPTIASLLGLSLDGADGRVLHEALKHHHVRYDVSEETIEAHAAIEKVCKASDPDCSTPGGPASYHLALHKKVLSLGPDAASYEYFDMAKATRSASRKRGRHRPDHNL